jgi:phosphomevalonate kinase
MNVRTASAPGKLVLLGDYAVLEGAVAIVAAVDRRASGRTVESAGPRSPIVAAVIAEAVRRKLPAPEVEIDTSAFADAGGNKLGLGSSAAVAVVAAALATGRGDEETLAIALDAHRHASGGGSGVDVASSFYGGVIAARRQPGEVQPLSSRLGKLNFAALFTGTSASTSELVSIVRRSPKWSEWSRTLSALAEEGVRAWDKQNASAFLSIVARYGRAMAGLGKDAGAPIVTEQIEAIMRIADELRGAAKPSGAGGGDVAIVWSFDPDVPRKIAERTGTTLLDLHVDLHGLSTKPLA